MKLQVMMRHHTARVAAPPNGLATTMAARTARLMCHLPRVLALCGIGMVLVTATPLFAQQQVPGRRVQILPGQRINLQGRLGAVNAEMPEGEGSIFFPADRPTLQKLSKATEHLEAKRYGEAVRLLGDILDGQEDQFFQPDRDKPVYRSLKSEAQRLIGALPSAGRESYELQFGVTASQMLDAAIASGNIEALEEIARRFFHTTAGHEATYLLGCLQMDRGQPTAAALSFQRLLTSPAAAQFEPDLSVKLAVCWSLTGSSSEATATLLALKERMPNATVRVAGKERALFTQTAAADTWLAEVVGEWNQQRLLGADQWTMYRGAASRNSASVGSSPLLNRRWAVKLAPSKDVEDALTARRQANLDQGLPVLPGSHALAVQDQVFIRTLAGLVAIDFQSGKRIWHGPVDESVQQMLDMTTQGTQWRRTDGITQWMNDRVWSDTTYGTMSSDGESVFCIEDLGAGADMATPQRQTVMANGALKPLPSGHTDYNRLAAYQIATEGKLLWTVGGDPAEGRLPLAGMFFLGAPLPIGETLYLLGELNGEIRLVALDARTGTEQWSQQLAVMTNKILEDTQRRLAGVSPSYADGVLVCPTAGGAVVAVDLMTRSLRWGYQYEQSLSADLQDGFPRGMFQTMDSGSGSSDRWADASLTVHDGHVLVTSPETEELHCLSLSDGQVLWKKPREDGLYVGCIHQETVLVVGKTNLRGLKLADGEPAWSESPQILPAGSTPSGRGYYSGEQYFLPLSSAEVAVVELNNGKISAISKSRNGTIPGNLICYRGSVISQNVDSVESFFQLDELRSQVAARLKEVPNDPVALARQGELLLDEGKLAESLAALRQSFEIAPEPRTRNLLVDALLEGLRADFAANQGNIDELETLVESTSQRVAYLRLVAVGRQQAGQILPAFETYLRMMELPQVTGELDRIDSTLSVRRERWIQTQLLSLRQAASATDAAEIDKSIAARLAMATEQAGPDPLRQFLRYFDQHTLAQTARETLLSRLDDAANLEKEMLLRRLEQSSDPLQARSAVARLLALLKHLGRNGEAQDYYARLAGPWAEEVCLDGKTGRQIVEELAADSPIRKALAGQPTWPVGHVDRQARAGGINPRHSVNMELMGNLGPFFTDGTVEWTQTSNAFVGRDGHGQERWSAPLADVNNPQMYGLNAAWNRGQAAGHLLIISMGTQIIGVDTLGSGKSGSVLWRHDLMEGVASTQRNFMRMQPAIKKPWGKARLPATDNYGRPLGILGPVSSQLVCFQKMRHLVAVNPLTGETLWTRFDTQPGSDLFGDDEMIFITAPDSNEALVVSALDGRTLGRRKIPEEISRMASVGRCSLNWHAGSKPSLTLTDAWTGEVVWKREFAEGARTYPVANDSVAVLDRSGDFVILNMADGQPQLTAKVDEEHQLAQIYVLRSRHQDLLVTNRPTQNPVNMSVHPIPNGLNLPLINGTVYGFDRATGKQQFATRLKNQGLSLEQPSELPVLVLATQINESQGRPNAPRPRSSILCLDRRTGRAIYSDRLDYALGNFDVLGDPEKREVTIKMQRSAITFTLTDDPLTPEETAEGPAEHDAVVDPAKAKTSGSKAKMGGLWTRLNQVREAISRANEQDDDEGQAEAAADAAEAAAEAADDAMDAAIEEEDELILEDPFPEFDADESDEDDPFGE